MTVLLPLLGEHRTRAGVGVAANADEHGKMLKESQTGENDSDADEPGI